MKEQDAKMNPLFNKISEIGIRVENQQECSSLRFLNLKSE